MKKLYCAVALAAGLVCFSVARAEPVTLDFNLKGIVANGDSVNGAYQKQHLSISGDGVFDDTSFSAPHDQVMVLGSPGTVTITMDAGWGFDLLTLDLFQSQGFALSASATNGSGVLATWSNTCSTGCGWVNGFTPFGKDPFKGIATKLTFTGSAAYFDNLTLEAVQTGGPVVPEPADIGLVGLALGAAGIASRRRRS